MCTNWLTFLSLLHLDKCYSGTALMRKRIFVLEMAIFKQENKWTCYLPVALLLYYQYSVCLLQPSDYYCLASTAPFSQIFVDLKMSSSLLKPSRFDNGSEFRTSLTKSRRNSSSCALLYFGYNIVPQEIDARNGLFGILLNSNTDKICKWHYVSSKLYLKSHLIKLGI